MELFSIKERGDVRALFSITFLMRSISIILQSLSPIVMVKLFLVPTSMVGWLIAAFWTANAFGALIAITIIRDRHKSTPVGFAILAFSFAGLATLQNALTYWAFIISSGLGLSIVQAYLVPSMYQTGNKQRPHSGIGIYSTALSLGLIAGPLSATIAIMLFGFSDLFLVLAVVSAITLAICAKIGFQKSYDSEAASIEILPKSMLKSIRSKGFTTPYALNFLYSLLLPILISYGGIYAESKFGISTSYALILFTVVFAISAALRSLFSALRIQRFHTLVTTGFIFLLLSFVLIGAAS